MQQALPDSVISIEFITYEKRLEEHLAAIVLTKTTPPQFIHIAPVDSIRELRIDDDLTLAEALTTTNNKRNINAIYTSSVLAHTLWTDPLRERIGTNNHIFFAADGITHQIAIEYLYPDTVPRRIHRLTSTRLLTAPHHNTRTDKMLLCGAINYDYNSPDTLLATDNDVAAYKIISSSNLALTQLRGTKEEIDSIHTIRRYHFDDTILSGDSATEYRVRQAMAHHHILLLATHGYCAPPATIVSDIQQAHTDTQLSQSCLFLTAANTNIHNDNFNPAQPDGILSAREISTLNLDDVDLAILSACSSARGVVTTDGVFGLQRGLKAAGVNAVIAALWDVNDNATAKLMQYLFAYINDGLPLYDAFAMAREKLINTTTTTRRFGMTRTQTFNYPNLYNAFILIDAI